MDWEQSNMSDFRLIGYLARGAPGYVGGNYYDSAGAALRAFFACHVDETKAILVNVYQRGPKANVHLQDVAEFTRDELVALTL